MPLDPNRARKCLQDFDFTKLFIEELGWDRHAQRLDVTVDGRTFTLSAVAHKRGMAAFRCEGPLPDHPTRRRIERRVAKSVHEHLLIFTDPEHTRQVWQWVKREPGKPLACREHTYHSGQPGDALIQKLQALAFALEDEESLTIVDVTSRVRAGFDVERVTKRFYDRFKTEHAAFLKFIKGIPDEEMHRWYASVMLNRLMFVYFIQKKGFLDGNIDYLRNKLARMKREGKDRFYTGFLCPLFFEGFARKAQNRSAATNELLGKVPYLNGGIFQRHRIEELHGEKIRIADAAFEKVFDFFEQYQWHLDERPLRRDNEINPDVLGYIFEKYINQKELGAYYTKEDITGYISQNTVIPSLFEAARAKCKVAFEGENAVWKLAQADPDRYIYPAVRHGVDIPLPPEIEKGVDTTKPNLLERRAGWNKPAPPEYALPTEIWREVVARRQRCQEVRRKLAAGEVTDINDFITLNLDIRQFAQDVIENSEPDLLWAFYKSLREVTILDPTCGSGAFLFAALNVLYPLYEACLNRMALFVEEWDRTGSKAHPNYSKNFKAELARLEAHHNEPYFILKTIIVNNLYGVDIMEEAVEICKLRLFLKLVAQVESADDIEPLPDIDFNIRAGNTLVGYATYEEVKRAVTSKLDFDNAMARIEDKAATLDSAFEMFRRQQTELGGEVTAADKRELRKRLEALETELNRYLAGEYGVDVPKVDEPSRLVKVDVDEPSRLVSDDETKRAASSALRSDRTKRDASSAFAAWLHSHKPFHWFIEFYGIMRRGGFDVIIGNPPFVEYSRVRTKYTVLPSFSTISCGNLYAMILERCYELVTESGFVSLITPLSLVCTGRTEGVRALVRPYENWISCYDMRPSSLFEGVAQRLCILVSRADASRSGRVAIAGYRRWATEERASLVCLTRYVSVTWPKDSGPLPKFASAIESSIMAKLSGPPLRQYCDLGSNVVYVHRIVRYFGKALDFLPLFKDECGRQGKSEDYKQFYFEPAEQGQIVALLNATVFYWFWRSHGDGFHCGYNDVYAMPYKRITDEGIRRSLAESSARLMKHLRDHSLLKKITTKAGNVVYQEFYPAVSKPIIDEIDRVLAKHYGFTEEEFDFIINYDIKYRMGLAEAPERRRIGLAGEDAGEEE